MRRLIAVLGATGAQGGGLARALLRDPAQRFAVRALTRQPDARVARALVQAGAEVVAADLDRPGTLAEALAGAHGLFAVTDFWEHFSPERELRQAGQLAAAAARAGVRRIVWSTQEDTRPGGAGPWRVPQMDAKGQADAFFKQLPTTYVLPSFYWDNLIQLGLLPRRDAEGRLRWRLPTGQARLCGIAAEDLGGCVAALFARAETCVGQRIGLASEQLTGEQMARVLSVVLGEPVLHDPLTPEDFGRQPFPGAYEMGRSFAHQQADEAAYCAARRPEVARALHPGLQDFHQWAAARAAVLRQLCT